MLWIWALAEGNRLDFSLVVRRRQRQTPDRSKSIVEAINRGRRPRVSNNDG